MAPRFVALRVPREMTMAQAIAVTRESVAAHERDDVAQIPHADDVWGHMLVLHGVLAARVRTEPYLLARLEHKLIQASVRRHSCD